LTLSEPADTAVPVVIVDDRPSRIRSSVDGIRLVMLVAGLLLLTGFGTLASNTSHGANDDLARLVSAIPAPLVHALTILGGFGALAVPLAVIVRQLVRGQTRRLVESLLSGLLAIIVVAILSYAINQAPNSALYDALTLVRGQYTTAPLDAYLAAWTALATVAGVANDRLWRDIVAAALAVYALSAFTAAQGSLLSLVASVLVGTTVGVAVRYVAGSVNERPDGTQIAAALAERGLPPTRLERLPMRTASDHRSYRAATRAGRAMWIDVLDRDEIASGLLVRMYRTARLQSEVVRGPALTLERAAERRTLLALAADAAGAPVPALLAGIPCGRDSVVLAYEDVSVTPLAALEPVPDDAQLRAVWSAVELLHHARISHPRLTASRIGVDGTGRVVLPILVEGNAFAGDLQINLDRAQVLMTCAELVGASPAVRVAREALGPQTLAAMLPVLQPIALSRETRQALKRNGSLMDDVRAEIQGQTSAPLPEPSRLERIRPRTVITLVALIIAGWLLIGQLGSVDIATVLSTADWRWVPLLLVASAVTYLAAAFSLSGFVRERLRFLRTVLAQLAASFTSFVLPPAVGGVTVNIRFLQKSGLSTTAAATSVGVSQVVNAITHVVLLIVFAAATGTSANHRLPIPGWAFIVLGAVAALALLALTLPWVRRWAGAKVLPPIRQALPRLLDLVTSPMKLVEGLGGTLLLNAAYITALWCAVQAFHGNLGVVTVAVVYLAGGAIGSIAPTPGGLGAVEAALSTGLAAGGMPGAAAVSAVLLYRIGTFWLPVPLGWLALQWLQRRNAL
jgi:glycosyltransferase 2 family protein